jgi:hypothetical protein
MLYFLPQLASKSSLKWLEKKWRHELEINPGLTYKGAFTLMAFKRNNYPPTNSQLISQTIQWLATQQNDDFGWGPWKGHSVGSDPWCTDGLKKNNSQTDSGLTTILRKGVVGLYTL